MLSPAATVQSDRQLGRVQHEGDAGLRGTPWALGGQAGNKGPTWGREQPGVHDSLLQNREAKELAECGLLSGSRTQG